MRDEELQKRIDRHFERQQKKERAALRNQAALAVLPTLAIRHGPDVAAKMAKKYADAFVTEMEG